MNLDKYTKQAIVAATTVLLKVRDELNQLLEVNRAFSQAAAALTKKETEDGHQHDQTQTHVLPLST